MATRCSPLTSSTRAKALLLSLWFAYLHAQHAGELRCWLAYVQDPAARMALSWPGGKLQQSGTHAPAACTAHTARYSRAQGSAQHAAAQQHSR